MRKYVMTTIRGTKVNGYLVTVTNGTPKADPIVHTIARVRDEKQAKREIEKLYPEGSTIVVDSIEATSAKYRCTIDEFLSLAKVVDDDTEEEDDDDDEEAETEEA